MLAMGAFLVCIFLLAHPADAAESLYVEGIDGVPLAMTVQGPVDGPEILLIHGLGHAKESFSAQLEAAELSQYRIVAFDMRGHGQSGKPWTQDGYNSAEIWAEDVSAVIGAAGLKRPVLVGWSYSGFVVLDYLRVRGADALAGLVMVNTLGGLVPVVPNAVEGAMEDLGQAYRLLGAPSFSNQQRAVDLIAPYLVAQDVAPEWAKQVRVSGMMLPPYVRPLLNAHPKDNADLLAQITVPLLIVHGVQDASLPATYVDQVAAAVPGTRIESYPDAGHTPFAEDPTRFNADLSAFVDAVWKAP